MKEETHTTEMQKLREGVKQLNQRIGELEAVEKHLSTELKEKTSRWDLKDKELTDKIDQLESELSMTISEAKRSSDVKDAEI